MKQVKKFSIGEDIPDSAKFVCLGPDESFYYEIKSTKKELPENGQLFGDEPDPVVVNVLNHLNKKLDLQKGFQATSKEHAKYIHARLKEGFKEEDFITVIDNMYQVWNNEKMRYLLRPKTLFNGDMTSRLAKGQDHQKKAEEAFDKIDTLFERKKNQ